jgi:phenylalanyl-tRNA synthetase beta chain
MKVSRAWLQNYFSAPLPEGQALADLFTSHSFEVDDMAGDLLDLKVLPDRAGYALSHRGIAYELAAALGTPLVNDPLSAPLPALKETPALSVSVDDAARSGRYSAALVRGVTVGPSPAWLKSALESVGQRSINNVVDATNYVMLNVGQPLHAFDAGKLAKSAESGGMSIRVRAAHAGEKIETLTGDVYALSGRETLIVDGVSDAALGIAGIKGGKAAEVTAATTDLIIEAAHFDAARTRRTAQALKLFTEASLRFQNSPSPRLTDYGMRDVLALITSIAGGTVEGAASSGAPHAPLPSIASSLSRINGLLGSSFTNEEVRGVFALLNFAVEESGDGFVVTPPFERTDICIPEDLAEEAGRILGYDRIPAAMLPPLAEKPDQDRFRGVERMKDELVERGFIEVSTQSFAKKGDIALANPLDKSKPALRTSLEENLKDALTRAKLYAPLVLPPGEKPKLFEAGTVFPKEGEYVELRMTEAAWEGVPTHDNLTIAKLEDYGKNYEPKQYALGAYKPFSAYPFIVRDIAAWTPKSADESAFERLVREHAGALLVRVDFVDRFEREGRISLALRLVFQSYERTLTDDEVNGVMARVTEAVTAAGYGVR